MASRKEILKNYLVDKTGNVIVVNLLNNMNEILTFEISPYRDIKYIWKCKKMDKEKFTDYIKTDRDLTTIIKNITDERE